MVETSQSFVKSNIQLILGGARSGKSSRAESLAKESDLAVVYCATSPVIAGDQSWQERIERHRKTRPAHWQTIEETLDLCGILASAQADQCVLIDCLTLWLFNIMEAGRNVEEETQQLCACLSDIDHEVILVSNELGMGLVPETALGRDFRDAQGRLNQAVAKCAHRVELMVAGIPMVVKEG